MNTNRKEMAHGTRHNTLLMRVLAILLASITMTALCRAAEIERQVRELRPTDTAAGETAVLDNLQHRAQEVLANIGHARTAAQADAQRAELRRKLTSSLGVGLLPWPPDLRARTVGTIVRPGYRIDRIVFQTLPGVLVPAHLYLPAGAEGRVPAVLFYVGHWWPDGKTKPDFQAFCINMARLGFVVLAWDPFGQGERGISSRDHRRVEALLVGISQQGFAEYETRCALEYLLSRKEVDPHRIGMTGASGGGYNTWITAALDDRIAVAVPVVGTSEFYEQIAVTRELDWYQAAEHCHFVPGLIRYANNHELLAMLAPKPLLIVSASKDQSFPVEGVREVYDYGRGLYGTYESSAKIKFFEDSEEGHGYQKRKREAAYGWFLRWLGGRGDGLPFAEPETTTDPFDSAEMRCFPAGRNEASGPGMIGAVRRIAAGLPRRPPEGSAGQVLKLPVESSDLKVRLNSQPLQRFEILSERDLMVPAFLILPSGPVRGLLAAVDDRGKEDTVLELPVDDMLQRGWAVLGVDPRGIGELRTSQMGWVAAVSLLLDENFVAKQAFDLRQTIGAVRRTLGDVPVGIYARGDNACLAATYALAGVDDASFYVLDSGFASFGQWLERPRSLSASFALKREDTDRTTSFDREIPFAYFRFNALRSFDLPDILRASQAHGLVVNPINGDWNPLSADEARKLLPDRVEMTTGAASKNVVRRFLIGQTGG